MKLFPPFRLDSVNECLWRSREAGADERIPLAPKSFEVLRYLVEHAGRLVTHRELLDSAWPDTFIEPQAVKKQIFDLRRALDDPPRTPHFIETVPRRGYRFIATVEDSALRTSAATAPPLTSRLVGRDGALAELRHCLRNALAGERQIVFITGEPGRRAVAAPTSRLGPLSRPARMRAERSPPESPPSGATPRPQAVHLAPSVSGDRAFLRLRLTG